MVIRRTDGGAGGPARAQAAPMINHNNSAAPDPIRDSTPVCYCRSHMLSSRAWQALGGHVLSSLLASMKKEVVTAEDVAAVPPGGELSASAGALVTAWAREVAATRGVRIVLGAPAGRSGVVAVGADHGGFALKEDVKACLTRLGRRFHDLGTFSTEPVDYPDVALAVARAVRGGEA